MKSNPYVYTLVRLAGKCGELVRHLTCEACGHIRATSTKEIVERMRGRITTLRFEGKTSKQIAELTGLSIYSINELQGLVDIPKPPKPISSRNKNRL